MNRQAKTAALNAALRALNLDVDNLQFRYYALGGVYTVEQVQQVLLGDLEPDNTQYDVLVQSLNDLFIDLGADHVVPYSDEIEL